MTTHLCDCLTKLTDTLPLHYVTCAAAAAVSDSTPERCLAELAAWRDIDTALLALREVRASFDSDRRYRAAHARCRRA